MRMKNSPKPIPAQQGQDQFVEAETRLGPVKGQKPDRREGETEAGQLRPGRHAFLHQGEDNRNKGGHQGGDGSHDTHPAPGQAHVQGHQAQDSEDSGQGPHDKMAQGGNLGGKSQGQDQQKKPRRSFGSEG